PFAMDILLQDGYQIFGTRQDEHIRVRVLRILILRQAFVGLTGDGGKGKGPSEAKGTVARTGVIGKRQLRAKARAAWACGDGHGHGASASDRVGTEFLAYA